MTTTGIVRSPGSGHAVIGTALGAPPAGIVPTESGLTARRPQERVRHAAVLGAMTHLVLASAAALVGPR